MFEVLLEKGFKRPTVIFSDAKTKEFALKLASELDLENLVILYFGSFELSNWQKTSLEIKDYFIQNKVRQINCIAFSQTVSLSVNLYLKDLKLFRSITFFNPHSRANKSFSQRLIDKLEKKLPMGLPFRFKTDAFDCKPFLQRIRCPILIVINKKNSSYRSDEVEDFLARVPTVYIYESDNENLSEIIKNLESFKEVPYKCPQKNR